MLISMDFFGLVYRSPCHNPSLDSAVSFLKCKHIVSATKLVPADRHYINNDAVTQVRYQSNVRGAPKQGKAHL